MGLFGMNKNAKWNADVKGDKGQSARDILGFRTSSRVGHEDKREKEKARAAARREKRQNSKPTSWWS